MLVSPTTYALLLVTAAGPATSALVRPGGPGTVPDWMVLGDDAGRCPDEDRYEFLDEPFDRDVLAEILTVTCSV